MPKESTTGKLGHFIRAFLGLSILTGAFSFSYLAAPNLVATLYVAAKGDVSDIIPTEEKLDTSKLPIHIATPEHVRGIYMTQCVVGTPDFRQKLVDIAEKTEINTIVIDIKDYSGKIAFPSDDPALAPSVSDKCGAVDMKEFVRSLNEKGIYVVGRITVFQDPYYTEAHPELAVKKASATSTLWSDYKGLHFIDAGAKPFWDYIVTLSKASFALGFDELNFDYIRFPSDGNMKDIYYPYSEAKVNADADNGKAEVVESFFEYLNEQLHGFTVTSVTPDGEIVEASPATSADLFGMTTTNTDDLNIGQQLEKALPYFDFVAPMTYPSHYPKGFNGWSDPNEHIYDVVRFSMDEAVKRTLATTTSVKALTETRLGTSTPAVYEKPAYDIYKIRPWIQDFDYGGNYDIPEVKAQIQAAYDAGLNSWVLWSPSNIYTTGALLPEKISGTSTEDIDQ